MVQMKIAIMHDYFDKMGGGERLVINLARKLKADIYTGYIDSAKTFDTAGINITSLNVKGRPQLYRNIKIAKKFQKYWIPGYDFYIFSGVWCITAAARHRPNMLYLHTPIRALYDLRKYYMKNSGTAKKMALRAFEKYWKPKDRKYMNNFDMICANSENVKKRVRKFYGNDLYGRTVVVYTGIETKKYRYEKSGDFYLSASRLDQLKRIDMIIRAFGKMPDKKLLITGTGPEEKRLKKLAKDSRNVFFLGKVNDEKMRTLYATCKATIAANIDEDLGLIAIESHASGKPIIAIKEGGFLETVNTKNGVFFKNEREIPAAIEKLERTKWNHREIQKTAERFDIKVFSKKIESIIRNN
jgi:glycosyltransferase involved in cell wall biosynthesis